MHLVRQKRYTVEIYNELGKSVVRHFDDLAEASQVWHDLVESTEASVEVWDNEKQDTVLRRD